MRQFLPSDPHSAQSLFLVIISLRPEHPSTVASKRQVFWRWFDPKLR